VEVIEPLGDMVLSIITDYKKQNPGKALKRIIYFRDGVAENQFEEVIKKEIPPIRSKYPLVLCWAKVDGF